VGEGRSGKRGLRGAWWGQGGVNAKREWEEDGELNKWRRVSRAWNGGKDGSMEVRRRGGWRGGSGVRLYGQGGEIRGRLAWRGLGSRKQEDINREVLMGEGDEEG